VGRPPLPGAGDEDPPGASLVHPRPDLGTPYHAPSTETERRIARIWQDVLRIERIGARDDLYAMGAHSLLAVQIIARVRDAFGVEVSIRDIFDAPTVAGLAERVEALAVPGAAPRLPPIVPVPRGHGLPLSLQQERLWTLDQLEPGVAFYNVCGAMRVRGIRGAAVAGRIFSEIVRRHEILRTVYRTGPDGPVQVVLDAFRFPVPEHDLLDLPEEARAAVAHQLSLDEARLPFDLENGLPIRARLVRVAPDEHLMLVTLHHIATDGWSWAILFGEWQALHGPFSRGEPSPLPPLPLQYADYAVWQRDTLAGEALGEQLAFWRGYLAGAPTVLELPADHPRPPARRYRGGLRMLQLRPEVAEQVHALCRREGATLYMGLLAAFKVLLWRYTGQDDLVVGTLDAGRERGEVEPLIGYFINTLATRTRLDGDPTFREALGRVREAARGAFAHAAVPLERVLAELRPERDRSHNPLVQVMFATQLPVKHGPEYAPDSGLTLQSLGEYADDEMAIDNGATKFDLTLLVGYVRRGTLAGFVEYDTDLFDAATIDRFAAHYLALLESIVADPAARISALPMLGEGERAALLHAPPVVYPDGERRLHELVERQAARTPAAPAVAWEGGTMSYGELDRRAEALAGRLRAAGAGPEARVAVRLERGPELPMALLAVLKAGAAYVPLDPGDPAERAAYVLADSGAALLLTQARLQGSPPAPGTPVIRVDDEAPGAFAPPPAVHAGPDALAYVIYTSGSTGRPKGAMVSHRAVVNRLLWMQQDHGLNASDAVLQKTPASFDVSVWELFWPLAVGARLVMARPGAHGDPEYLAEVIERERITTLHFVPSMLEPFLDHARLERCAGLRRVMSSGEALPAALARRFFAALPGAGLHNLYGPTEAAVDVTRRPCLPGALPRGVPIGRPAPNTSIRVLDARMALCPVGVPGDLYIGGVQGGRGYHGRPGLTAASWVPDPFAADPGARLYRSGDRARWRPDGELEFLGRADQQVKLRGFRIETGEIEAALREHDGVRDAVVMVREDAPGGRRLVAYVTARAEGQIDPGAAREALRARLPDYMVPAALVVLDALPLTPSGKVDRLRLPAPAPAAAAGGYVAPRDEVERCLADAWAAVLRVARVGVHDNLFELGGDSVASIRIAAAVRAHGVAVTPRDFFAHPTVAGLAALARSAAPPAPAEGPPRAAPGPVPLTPIQHAFFEREVPARQRWNQALLVEARPPLHPAALERAVAAVRDHHDALRLRFRREGAAWVQLQGGGGGRAPVATIDLSALDGAARAPARDAAAARVREGLHLADGPLFRAAWLHAGADAPGMLLVVAHHLVVDPASWRLLLADLEDACEQAEGGRAVALPPRTGSFAGWAERLAAYAPPPAELEYWTQPAPDAPPLPRDPVRGPNTLASARTVTVSLDAAETRALHAAAAGWRTRPDDVVLAALAAAVARWTDGRAVRVALEEDGRDAPLQGEPVWRTVGWFTTVYPVVLRPADGLPPGERVAAVREQVDAVPARGVGHGALLYGSPDAAVRRRMRDVPPAELGFGYVGSFRRSFAPSRRFVPAADPGGVGMDPRALRSRPLDVAAAIEDDCLRVRWTYSANLHRDETIARAAAGFLAELRSLLGGADPAARAHTPADFPLAGLDDAGLARLEEEFPGFQDVYPLAPLQQGMLFEALSAPADKMEFAQYVYGIEGAVDEDAMERAWNAVLERHPALRVAFTWEDTPLPLQVVGPAPLRMERVDLRTRPAGERGERLAAHLRADASRGFDITRPPLMRLALMRTGDQSFHLVWSFHHLLLDGWCLPIVFREVLAHYDAFSRGERVHMRAAPAYRDYVEWLARQDLSRAEPFWRAELKGFSSPTRVVLPGARDIPADGDGWGRTDAALGADASGRLREFTRRNRLTIGTVLQGAWALLLSRYTGQDDILFATVTSGRPAELPGVEEMVGLFINTLPVRVSVGADERLVSWLARLQERNAALREHEHTPLSRIRRWSSVPAGEPLFESIVVFENFPFEAESIPETPGLRITPQAERERTRIPLMLSASARRELSIRLEYEEQRYGARAAERIVGGLVHLISGMIGAEDGTLLGELSLLSAEEHAALLAWEASSSAS
jgi:amino acid adenylation domain-containing protein/non-ribosomal peptide synthase protein (TIGR01720 family)